jgi:hypothetical protein
MDTLAKEILNLLPQPLPSQIYGEPWRIQLEGEKIIKDQQARLYENVHKGKALWLWRKQKRRLTFTNDGSPPCKHASGMCRVGKFLNIWKENKTDACPR